MGEERDFEKQSTKLVFKYMSGNEGQPFNVSLQSSFFRGFQACAQSDIGGTAFGLRVIVLIP